MPSDYAAIRKANKAEYGNVGRWGRDILVNRYDSSAHFIHELLQNTEDALRRRSGWSGSRAIQFALSPSSLRITHCGHPFTEEDVRGVCGVGETTKNLTDIGRFGIGFKSVYAITDRPEVHSGAEDFAIESFVLPQAIPPTNRAADQTELVLPLRSGDVDLFPLVADGLSKLGARTLLFLRQIDEIAWSVDGGASGLYLRGRAEDAGDGMRRVTLVGERKGEPLVEETWLVFSREASTEAGTRAGFVEVAFLLQEDKASREWAVQRVDTSPLFVFFPTVLPTHLGLLVQGPYRTTPSRDNVPPRDPWNVKLVQHTAALLLEAVKALKSMGLLNVATLECLPIERANYPEDSMLAPLFGAVLSALASEPLLPRADGGWTAAKNARLARTQELRELLDSRQLAALLGASEELHWLSSEITRDTAATLRHYLLHELKITEVTPELILPRLTKRFLEAQPDAWICKLYEFLAGQPALVRQERVYGIPLVRLEDGTHVVATANGQPQAFLPTEFRTDFPTVRRSTSSTAKALEFLKTLGVTEPDAVDDVVRNVIPRYMQTTVEADDEEYAADIKRLVNAFGTPLRSQRDKLLEALKKACFVMAVDSGDRSEYVARPDEVYLATDRLKELFAGVPDVLLLDDSYACLKGEDVRELLEACGAVRYLRPVPDTTLSWEARRELREKAGHASTSGYNDQVEDHNLQGLPALLATLPGLTPEERRKKSRLIWEELTNLEERRGKGLFDGEYTWTHYGKYRTSFDAAFVRTLNRAPWIPDESGNLQRPEVVLFGSLGWQANPFLLSKIRFRPPILDQLAKEAGIEPGMLDLLKKRGITSEAQLMELLGVEGEVSTGDGPSDVGSALGALGIAEPPTPAVAEWLDGAHSHSGGSGAGNGPEAASGADGGRQPDRGDHSGANPGADSTAALTSNLRRTPANAGGWSFVSYVAVHPDREGPDPDGLEHTGRMALEERAIELILSREPEWRRTPTHNPGFDLYMGNNPVEATRWCEVKAMTVRLTDRPVGLSRTQFEWALEHGGDYWLYVVERAGTDEARLVRIQNPAGNARTFTFDHGWLHIAEADAVEEPSED